jgi:predicted transcriptional regulator of viral defense system
MPSEDFFQTHPVFTREDYALTRGGTSPRTVDSLLRKHVASGRIARVRRGLYVAPPRGVRAEAMDPFLIASKAAPDAAVSHHAALQFHGRTYGVWSHVTFLTTHAARRFRFGPVTYAPVRPPEAVANLPDMGGGLVSVPSGGGDVRVSTCERAMVDVLHSPDLGGGWEEVFRSLGMVAYFDLEEVVRYALALDCAVTAARVGFYLSLHRSRLFVEESHLARLAAEAPKQARYLDAARTPGRLVHPWNLIVPDHVREVLWEEVA